MAWGRRSAKAAAKPASGLVRLRAMPLRSRKVKRKAPLFCIRAISVSASSPVNVHLRPVRQGRALSGSVRLFVADTAGRGCDHRPHGGAAQARMQKTVATAGPHCALSLVSRGKTAVFRAAARVADS